MKATMKLSKRVKYIRVVQYVQEVNHISYTCLDYCWIDIKQMREIYIWYLLTQKKLILVYLGSYVLGLRGKDPL